jgi:hypothetical protein
MAATIRPFIKGATFESEAVASMGDAFERACAATAALGQPSIHQAIIAKRIIELAKAGERHPQVLCDRALQALRLPYAEHSQPAPETAK